MTPFRAVYGRDPPTLIKYEHSPVDPPKLQEMLMERDAVIVQLKANLTKAQIFMKKYADSKRRAMDFNIGDMVLVKLQPYRQHSVALRSNQKLGLRYFGPFPIIEKIGEVVYKLMLPPSAKIHPVFHISLLKPCKGVHDTQYKPLPLLTNENCPLLIPKSILQFQILLRNNQHVPQVLVHWEGLPVAEATWEDWVPLHHAYPYLNLDDKVVFNGGSNVMTENATCEMTPGLTDSVKGRGQVAIDLNNQGVRRGNRERKHNRKYAEDYV